MEDWRKFHVVTDFNSHTKRLVNARRRLVFVIRMVELRFGVVGRRVCLVVGLRRTRRKEDREVLHLIYTRRLRRIAAGDNQNRTV